MEPEYGRQVAAPAWRTLCTAALLLLLLGVGEARQCGQCDRRTCPFVSPDTCRGQVVKDACDCCPVCVSSAEPNATLVAGDLGSSVCSSVQCGRTEICVLNIQNIPVCRCPSVYWCRRRRERREICGRDGKTYRSRCYLRIAECTLNKKIRVAHKGSCNAPRKRKGQGGGMPGARMDQPTTSQPRQHPEQHLQHTVKQYPTKHHPIIPSPTPLKPRHRQHRQNHNQGKDMARETDHAPVRGLDTEMVRTPPGRQQGKETGRTPEWEQDRAVGREREQDRAVGRQPDRAKLKPSRRDEGKESGKEFSQNMGRDNIMDVERERETEKGFGQPAGRNPKRGTRMEGGRDMDRHQGPKKRRRMNKKQNRNRQDRIKRRNRLSYVFE